MFFIEKGLNLVYIYVRHYLVVKDMFLKHPDV